MIELYPDQEEFLQGIREAYRKHTRFVAMACTGFGKTRCAARIIEGCIKSGMRVCFTVPRTALITQTGDSFRELGLTDITYMWADMEVDQKASITIASIDTYIRRKKGEYDLTIVDECQHRREQMLNWMDEHPEDRYIGLTATPYSPFLGKYYTGLVKSKSMRWLIDNNRLSEYEIFAPNVPDMSGVKKQQTSLGYDYVESDLESIMGDAKVVGDVVKHWLDNGENRLTMALCVNINHANHLCNEFNSVGVRSETITANTPIDERQAIYQRMRDGITRIVLSVNCLTEGFDMKEVSCLINARPTKSKSRYIQGIGRALRYLPGKVALIFDHSGTTLDLGFPEDIDIDELPNGTEPSQQEQIRQEKEKKEKEPKKCAKCDFLKPAGVFVCPKCGEKPTMIGENVLVDESIGLTKIKGDKKQATDKEKQEFYSGLISHQIKKGFKPGWTAHTFKDKYGHFPSKQMHKTPMEPTDSVLSFIKHKAIKNAKSRMTPEEKAKQKERRKSAIKKLRESLQ